MATRKRIIGRQYELARFYAPEKEAEFIIAHADELKRCEGHKVYDYLRDQERLVRNYAEQQSNQYLRSLFFCLRTETPILLKVGGGVMAVPTNEIEQRQFPWKECKCVELSLRVKLQEHQVHTVEQMMAIVERKMRSFKSDFYFHDMKTMVRCLGSKPMLWVVGTSHTINEVHDAEDFANEWTNCEQEDRRRHFLYGGDDDTWLGAALRVLCAQDDECYYIDRSGQLYQISRDKLSTMHNEYVERVRQIAIEKMNPKVA